MLLLSFGRPENRLRCPKLAEAEAGEGPQEIPIQPNCPIATYAAKEAQFLNQACRLRSAVGELIRLWRVCRFQRGNRLERPSQPLPSSRRSTRSCRRGRFQLLLKDWWRT